MMATVLVARTNILPCLDERARQRGVMNDDRSRRQIVEQGRRPFEEQRQVELDARRGDAVTYASIDCCLGRVAFEARTEATAEFLDGIGVERHFARGEQAYVLQ